ncbi:glycosyltransferase [Arthrobacter ramosus]|uniref:Glycosyltransferase n=1 Tax=Arthrobacter ramosus TaxID=1672 RepID=A0ABV5XUW9_ARTRM|nr:glycosyltransferase [Arthrobacter ramosus]
MAQHIAPEKIVKRRSSVVCDLLIANDFRSVWQSLLFDGPRKRLFVGHGQWQFSKSRVSLLDLMNIPTFVVSQPVAQYAIESGLKKRPTVLPLGPKKACRTTHVDLDSLSLNRPGGLVFGTVSRLDPIKRLDLFARATQELGVHGIMIVPEPTSVEEHGIIDLLASFENIEIRKNASADAIWGDIDIFLSTSAAESLGLAHLEALINGVPVISTASHGPSDFMLGELRAGWIPDTDENQISEAVARSISSIQAAAGGYWSAARSILRDRGIARCADLLLGE